MGMWRAAVVGVVLCLSIVATEAHAQSWASLATISFMALEFDWRSAVVALSKGSTPDRFTSGAGHSCRLDSRLLTDPGYVNRMIPLRVSQ